MRARLYTSYIYRPRPLGGTGLIDKQGRPTKIENARAKDGTRLYEAMEAIRSEIESMSWDELNQRLAQAREVMADK